MRKTFEIMPGAGVLVPTGEGEGSLRWEAVQGVTLDGLIITASSARYSLDAVQGVMPNFDPDTGADYAWRFAQRTAQLIDKLHAMLDALHVEFSGLVGWGIEVSVVSPIQTQIPGWEPDHTGKDGDMYDYYWALYGEDSQ